jgi:cystathionine beta-lyase/cystathionine gamma-synthase
MKFSTKALHIGQEPDPSTGSISTPIFQTSSFVQEGLGQHRGFSYSRTGNPTRQALETCLAALEQGRFGLCYASGLAAISNVMMLLSQGDHVVAGDEIYGGTFRLFEKVFSRYGISFTYVDTKSLGAVEAAIQSNTKMLWLESPTNPLLRLADLDALIKLASSGTKNGARIITVVDNTFATPYNQNPLVMGADVVVHSFTKWLGGHSDVVGGAIVLNDEELHETLKFHQNAVGAILGPFDSWLVLRGLKTLALRMEAHHTNALAAAEFFAGHKAIEKVFYPGLPSHPQYELACRQMRGFGAVVSCVVKGGLPAVEHVLKRTKLFALAEGLGGVESMIGHPPTMSHGSLPKEVKEAQGLVDGLLRFSVGVEDKDDLLEDLEYALAGI